MEMIYKKNRNAIICGNCVEVMEKFPSDKVDLVVTSPPYDNLRDYKGYAFNYQDVIKSLYRVIKSGGVVVWIVGDASIDRSETGSSFKHVLYFKEIGFNLHDTMIYQKYGFRLPSTQAHARYHQGFEFMFVFSKERVKTFNPICDRNVADSGNIKRKSERKKSGELVYSEKKKRGKNGEYVSMYPRNANLDKHIIGKRTNVWQYFSGGSATKDKETYKHPAVFPEKLAEDHILSWSNPGDLVLDPMCGSGTVCKMASINKRRFIGIDVSKEYCEIAKERILKYD